MFSPYPCHFAATAQFPRISNRFFCLVSFYTQVHHLLPKLRAAGSSRVISLASRAHFRHQEDIDYLRLKKESAATYDGWTAYGRSKLSNILMTKVCNPSKHFRSTKEQNAIRTRILFFGRLLQPVFLSRLACLSTRTIQE
jgi:hypothetical protein